MSGEAELDITGHYQRCHPIYEALGELQGELCPANADREKWYKYRRDGPNGWDGTGRPFSLSRDYADLFARIDRVLYTTVNYASPDWFAGSWKPYRHGVDRKEWMGGSNPMPEYSDLRAYAPVVDVDLADDVKPKRPDGDIPTAAVERALSEWIDAFAGLTGSREPVHVLDSVGGAYVLLAPSVTAPIGEEFAGADRGTILNELTNRLNGWLEDVAADVIAAVPEVEGVFEPDLVNQKNRLIKAPMSLHASLDGVVTPIDCDSPAYTYRQLSAVTSAEIERTARWAESYTADYSDRVESLVAALWTEEYVEHESWAAALRAWLEAKQDAEEAAAASTPEPSGTPGAELAPVAEVNQQLDALDAERVAERTIVAKWNDDAQTSDDARAFYPTWGPNCNGTANIIGDGVWVDTGSGHKGGVVEMALIAAGGWPRGEWARGDDRLRGIEELRRLGFDVPLPVSDPDDDMSPYYTLPLRSIAREQWGDDADLFEDPERLLKVCLLARDEYGAEVDGTPPYKVLIEVAERVGLRFEDPEEMILGRDSHRLAARIFDSIAPEDA